MSTHVKLAKKKKNAKKKNIHSKIYTVTEYIALWPGSKCVSNFWVNAEIKEILQFGIWYFKLYKNVSCVSFIKEDK